MSNAILSTMLFALLVTRPALAEMRMVPVPGPVRVTLRVGQPVAVTFPEALQALVTGADPKTLSLEQVGARVFLQALTPETHGVLFALGESGTSYAIQYRVGEPADTEVFLQTALPRGTAAPRETAAPITVSRLLKAMMRREPLPGVPETADHQILVETDGLRITTTWVYLATPYRGYVAEAENQSDRPRQLLLPRYFVPGLLAIAAEAEVLAPRARTRVYLVFQPGGP